MHRKTSYIFLLIGLISSASICSFALRNASVLSVSFVDITDSSGITFRNSNSATPDKYLIETMTGGVAIFDYDKDGWPDIFFVNGAPHNSGQPDNVPFLTNLIRNTGTASIQQSRWHLHGCDGASWIARHRIRNGSRSRRL